MVCTRHVSWIILAILLVGCTVEQQDVTKATEQTPREVPGSEETVMPENREESQQLVGSLETTETKKNETSGGSSTPEQVEIIINMRAIEPEEVVVSRGTTVVWKKVDKRNHRIIAVSYTHLTLPTKA